VIIRLCSIECNFARPFSDPSNSAFEQDLSNWANISKRLYVWNYATNFGSFLAPFPNYKVIGANIKLFKTYGVKGWFAEGAYAGPGGELNEMKDYLTSKLLFDTSLNPDKVMADFLHGYYGAAEVFVQEYINVMASAAEATGFFMHEYFDPISTATAPFLTPAVILAAGNSFRQARAVVTGAELVHIKCSSLSVYWVALWRWKELREYARAQMTLAAWPFEPTLQGAFKTFSEAYNTTSRRFNGTVYFKEFDNSSLPWLQTQLFPTPPPPPPPMQCPGGATAVTVHSRARLPSKENLALIFPWRLLQPY
jgi:hypothetical protein